MFDANESIGPVEETRAHWALAVALQLISDSALQGKTTHRTQIVCEYLQMAANCSVLAPELRATCIGLVELWKTINAAESAHPLPA